MNDLFCELEHRINLRDRMLIVSLFCYLHAIYRHTTVKRQTIFCRMWSCGLYSIETLVAYKNFCIKNIK